MKLLLPIVAIIVATIGTISTLDWESSTAELVRWCLAILFVIVLALFLSGCSTGKALLDACRDGLCR